MLRNPSHDDQIDDQRRRTEEFRRYENTNDRIQQRVFRHYADQHAMQTVDFVRSMHEKWLGFTHAKLGLLDALRLLADYIDASDPDVDVPNLVHAYQTAERIRRAHPDKPWLQLTGLIHDVGKIMSVWGETTWATTGDTYPVGCAPADAIVYRDYGFDVNPDTHNSKYSTRLGMYEEGCGLGNLLMTFGHDEYMYRVLKHHPQCTLPDEALYAIRFHSFYAYHTGNQYRQFVNDEDRKCYPCLMELNKYDLYSKADDHPDIEKLEPYYQQLVDQYVPGLISF
jgi:inositol oxygenase